MRIASLPDYDLIAEINDKSKIKNDTDYIFAFFTASSRKNSFILEDIEVVNEFDGKMWRFINKWNYDEVAYIDDSTFFCVFVFLFNYLSFISFSFTT